MNRRLDEQKQRQAQITSKQMKEGEQAVRRYDRMCLQLNEFGCFKRPRDCLKSVALLLCWCSRLTDYYKSWSLHVILAAVLYTLTWTCFMPRWR